MYLPPEEANEEAGACGTSTKSRNPRRKRANLKGMSDEDKREHERRRNAESSKRSREKKKQTESDIYKEYFLEKEKNEKLRGIHGNLEKTRDELKRYLCDKEGNQK